MGDIGNSFIFNTYLEIGKIYNTPDDPLIESFVVTKRKSNINTGVTFYLKGEVKDIRIESTLNYENI